MSKIYFLYESKTVSDKNLYKSPVTISDFTGALKRLIHTAESLSDTDTSNWISSFSMKGLHGSLFYFYSNFNRIFC